MLTEQQDGEYGKRVGAEAIAKRPSGEAAEKGEGDQDPGWEPGSGGDAYGHDVGGKARCIGECEERE